MKRKLHTSLVFACFMLFLYSCKKDMQFLRPPAQQIQNKKEDRSFIIIAKKDADLAAIGKELIAIGAKKFKIKESLKELGLITVVTPDPSFPSKARMIKNVENVAINLTTNFRLPEKIKTSKFRNTKDQPAARTLADPLSVLQWGLRSSNALGAWKAGYSGRNATVAILDGGFFLEDPEIAPNVIGAQNFVEGEDVEFAGFGFSHGNYVAGIVAAASDGHGIVGAAPRAKLLLVKVLSDSGRGSYESIINGILYAANQKANVINMSFGGYLPTHDFNDDNGTPDDPVDDYIVNYEKDVKPIVTALERATLYATLSGSLCIAAAGNDAIDVSNLPDFNIYPAESLGVWAIAANGPIGWGYYQSTNLFKPAYPYTNYGKSVIAFGAPGGNYDDTKAPDETIVNVRGYNIPASIADWVMGTGDLEDDGYLYYVWATGTSGAAPYASAVAAMIYGKYQGNIAPFLVALIMQQSAKDLGAPGRDDYFGFGQVDAGKAVSL